MRQQCIFVTCFLAACHSNTSPPQTPTTELRQKSDVSPSTQKTESKTQSSGVIIGNLQPWFDAFLPIQDQETFGALIQRIAQSRLKTPYFDPPNTLEDDLFKIRVETFQCVSFVEITLALARCAWLNTPSDTCATKEVENMRYRDGIRQGYPSKLHYFSEWLLDAEEKNVVKSLGLTQNPSTKDIHYMSAHPKHYAALADASILQNIQAKEKQLSSIKMPVLEGLELIDKQKDIQAGDVIAIVSQKAGIWVSHAGFAAEVISGLNNPRLLHASSHHGRVVMTKEAIAHYIGRQKKRRGIFVYRPLPPKKS